MGDVREPTAANEPVTASPASGQSPACASLGASLSPESLMTPGGVLALQRAIGNRNVARLLPARTLARQHAPVATATQRPTGDAFFGGYDPISYDRMNYFLLRTDPQYWFKRNEVWQFLGGSIGRLFGARDPSNPNATGKEGAPGSPQHTCAARVSYALNHTPGQRLSTGIYNDPKVEYAGLAGDGDRYIVGTPTLQKYLAQHWGAPDQKLTSADQATALRGTLTDRQVAVFCSRDHTGVISKRLQPDKEYIYHQAADVVSASDPAWLWLLP